MRIAALPALVVCCSCWAQSQPGQEKGQAIELRDLGDNGTHWYEIRSKKATIRPEPGQSRYRPEEIEKIADNMLLFQKDNGGWPKNYDMTAVLSDEQREKILKAKSGLDTTFDNGTTYSQIGFLAKAYRITKAEKYKAACLRGIEFALSAQYANGGWPQFFPLRQDYSRRITFNDGAMTGVMRLLKDIVDGRREYAFVGPALRAKAAAAFEKGLDDVLDCQITDNGYLTAWAQQHGEKDLRPAKGREYELPAIADEESADVVLFLMSINDPDERTINAVEAAVDWFKESKIRGIRVEEIAAPEARFRNRLRASEIDRIVVKDPEAPPIWARFYELGTHKPLFADRRGVPLSSLAAVDRERRVGYDFYTARPQKVLDAYAEWRKRRAGIEWVTIPGGRFMMGADDVGPDAQPRHRVTVKTFQMAKTLVTFGQYKKCVEDDACTAPHVSDGLCYGWSGSQWTGNLPDSFQGDDQPVVCIDRSQARTFARWAGGRLPTEAEWEYAARDAGKEQKYPWGDEAPSCERAVFDSGGMGCGRNSTWPVCSKPKGNTRQGLCDMAGNVWQWVEDAYHESYSGAPADGAAWDDPPSASQVVRGGAWIYRGAAFLRSAGRRDFLSGDRYCIFGMRLARSSP